MTPSIAVILALLSLAQIGWAQIGYNANTNSLLCSKPGGHYCVHGSLQGPTMISCVSITTAEIRSCNIELANILPAGYKDLAICYETAPILGDALCAFNGTGYPRSGDPISIPETVICTGSYLEDNDDNKYAVDIDNGTEADTVLASPDQLETYQDADVVPAPRERSQQGPASISILETEQENENEQNKENPQPTGPLTPRPENEKGTIQTISMTSVPIPHALTSVPTLSTDYSPSSSLIMTVPSTFSTMSRPTGIPSPGQSSGVSGSGSGFSMSTATPMATPTLRRPRLADKCSWTPTPMYKTGAVVLRSSSSSSSSSYSVASTLSSSSSAMVSSSSSAGSSSSVSVSASISGTEDGAAAETSTTKKSDAWSVQKSWVDRGQVGGGILMGWIVGWVVVVGLV